jgi:hypothetical protein
MRIDDGEPLTMPQPGTDQSIQASAGLELIEATQSAKHLLTHFFALPQAVNNLEILVGTGGFDSKKHCCWLALHPATTNHVSKQYKS